MDETDIDLLRRHVRDRDDAAFAELVRRRVDLVYSAARRRVGGDEHRAREVTQRVFIDLARRAARLTGHTCLVAWLHRATRYAVVDLLRAESRRRQADDVAVDTLTEGDAMDRAPALDWERASPLLDAALDELGEKDRAAVLLRFFEQRPFAEVGAALGLAENAARMRTERALEKLRRALARRGVTSSAGALAVALAQQAVGAAPATLVATTSAASLAAGAVAGVGASGAAGWILMNTSKWSVGVAAVVGLVVIGGASWSHWRPEAPAANAERVDGAVVAPSRDFESGFAAAPRASATAVTSPPAERLPSLAEALALTDPFRRKAALESLGHDTAARDATEALRVLAGLKERADRLAFIDGMMAAASKMTPADAVLLVAEIPAGVERDGGMRTLARFWGVEVDGHRALTSFMNRSTAAGIGQLVASQDPWRGIAWANALLEGDQRERLNVLGQSVGTLARKDREAALAFVRGLGDEREITAACSQIAIPWAEQDPEAAFAWARSLTGDAQRGATLNTVWTWSLRDIAAATARAAALPSGQSREALKSIGTSLVGRSGIDVAKEWAVALPPGPVRDELVRDVAAIKVTTRTNDDGSVTKIAEMPDGTSSRLFKP